MMEREKVIELVKQAGDIGDCYCQTIMVNDRDADDWVMAFARLVEKETLERAAKKCEEVAESWIDESNKDTALPLICECAFEIRNLKDNHDKE